MDLDPAKLEALAAEMARLGVTNVRTEALDLTAGGPEAEPVPAADRVLVDAPCSGLGVLRRHPEARWLRDKRNLPRFADRQLALLERASRWVKPGGCLVYAVCSLEPEEGPDVVAAFLDRHRAFAQAPAAETEAGVLLPFADPAGRLCTLPHRHGMDGFFAARVTKTL
jgi:16S rRNA (cytosine967-C5)-methyltransferase